MTTDEFVKVIRAVDGFRRTSVDLGAIAVPTLVLWGEHEPPFLRRQAAKLAAEVPDARGRSIPGAGHASNLDNPEAFTRVIRQCYSAIGDAE